MKKGYNGYLISSNSRNYMLQHFSPKYKKVIAHHITYSFGVEKSLPPTAELTKVIGYRDSGDGLEAFVVEINGKVNRPDGKLYHITYSLDPEKYKPKDSNTLITNMGYTNVKPFLIEVKPTFFAYW